MKFILLILALLVSLSSLAEVEKEFSGNLEAQTRHTWNNPQAEDLAQEWDEENFSLIYGNLNGKVKFGRSRVEANWFVRYSYSELYEEDPVPVVAPLIFTFPNKLVARDIFKLQYRKQENNYQTESVLNKFFYEWDSDKHRFAIGRMYINYGQGEIFNPLNPFNQPTGLTSISQVAQGNDGMAFTFFVNDKNTIEFYLLGDKAIEGYDGTINRTLWAHGEYQATENLQLDYVMGEDQKRQKLGGQISYRFEEAMVFSQVLYQSEYVDNDPSHNLWDGMLGYDQQLTAKWHVRFEGGYQKQNRFATSNAFGERFLPIEYFVALANQYEFHPLVKLSGTFVNDVKSGFTYLIAKSTFDLGRGFEAELFVFTPIIQGGNVENPAQKLVTTDIGAAIRAFF